MITKAVRARLLESNVSVGGRIHSGRAEQGSAFPYIRLTSTMIPERCREGIGMRIYTVQVDVFSQDYAECVTVSEQVISSLESWSGSYAGIEIRDSQFTNENEGFNDLEDLEQRIVEFEITTNA